ncbi:hypothetical protein Fmac_017559 [Flemingia macrophylla]|uniref:Uncharacterized protein n=1 Tax=Flemingia macrophylla TaxID=520843 RepID=A0ABD1M2H0_9FABA
MFLGILCYHSDPMKASLAWLHKFENFITHMSQNSSKQPHNTLFQHVIIYPTQNNIQLQKTHQN